MELFDKHGAFADLNLRPVDVDLPISGGIRYQSMPDGSVFEVDLNKTF